MEGVIWYVLAGTRGGENRARILHEIDERPQNPNQIAEALELNYTTVRHHLDVLTENGMVEQAGEGYGAVYLPTDRVRDYWDVVERIASGEE
jgi:DNA-binding transcriptional ArsR family regulator